MDEPKMKVVPVEFRDVIATSIPTGAKSSQFYQSFNSFHFMDSGYGAEYVHPDNGLIEGIRFFDSTDPTSGKTSYDTASGAITNFGGYDIKNLGIKVSDLLAGLYNPNVSTAKYNGTYRFLQDQDGSFYFWFESKNLL